MMEIKRQFPVVNYKHAEVLRRQFPIHSASAKTTHRFKGDTTETAVVDFTEKARCHCHYVSLSRAKSLSEVYIRTLNESNIYVSEQVKLQMSRLPADK